MTLYAIISDIHANEKALRAVFDDIDGQNVDQILCLGDTVNYGVKPNETVALVRERAGVVLLGNHDQASFGTEPVEHYMGKWNPQAIASLFWTRAHLSGENKRYLSTLKPVRSLDDRMVIAHSEFIYSDIFPYLLGGEDTLRNLGKIKHEGYSVGFIGHTHSPGIHSLVPSQIEIELPNEEPYLKEVEGFMPQIEPKKEGQVQFEEGSTHIVNVGSVGQPRDGDRKACYVLYDSETRRVTIRRVEYDVFGAQDQIRNSGMTEFLFDAVPELRRDITKLAEDNIVLEAKIADRLPWGL